nr:MAG TPA: hypothetical protein [Caudoviricetes sp.]
MVKSIPNTCSSHIGAIRKGLSCLCRTQNNRQPYIILLQKNV